MRIPRSPHPRGLIPLGDIARLSTRIRALGELRERLIRRAVGDSRSVDEFLERRIGDSLDAFIREGYLVTQHATLDRIAALRERLTSIYERVGRGDSPPDVAEVRSILGELETEMHHLLSPDTYVEHYSPELVSDSSHPASSTATPAHLAGLEVFSELAGEHGTNPIQAPSAAPRSQQVQDAVLDAMAAGDVDYEGNPLGVDAAVQPYERAPDVRGAFGQTGRERQAAHMTGTSLLRTLPGYSRAEAITSLLDPETHRAFDHHWLRWVSNRRRAIRAMGSGDFTATLSDVLDAHRQAIRQTPNLTARQRDVFEWLIEREIQSFARGLPDGTGGLPDGMNTRVPLPAVWGS